MRTVKPRADLGTRKILFLFSDTGGGHRSAAEAIIEAIHLENAEGLSTEMVDVFKEYAPLPLNYVPTIYPILARSPQAWGLGYRLSDGEHRARLLTASTWPYVRRSLRAMVRDHPSDLIVSVHPLATAPALRALGKNRPPFITVVTDMVTTHALWYNRKTDLCIVPTEAARKRAMIFGLKPNQVQVIGLPVAERFRNPLGDQHSLREKLGWPEDRLLVLLVGGGEGMGPLAESAVAIAESGLPLSLVVVTGRNVALKERLEATEWPMPVFIYGFVKNMPDFMLAADVLVTKAGPGTISEAFIAGLPLILYSRLPGQEDGNVSYVVSEGAGVWAPEPAQIVATLHQWVEAPDERIAASMASKRLARPNAAREIARILAKWATVSKAQDLPVWKAE